MPYFLTNNQIKLDSEIKLEGDEFHHLTVSKRTKVGELIKIQDQSENRFTCEVLSINKKNAILKPINKLIPPPESPLSTTLCVAYVSENNLDIIITKSTELGVNNIVIFQGELSPSNLESKSSNKLSRWERIALEATKQCERIRPPKLTLSKNLEETLEITKDSDLRLLLDNKPSADIFPNTKIGSLSIFIGPEGGFSENERLLTSQTTNLKSLCLGPRILKTETACITGISLAQFTYGDLKNGHFVL